MNTYKEIEELLNKYWECNTGIEEEDFLKDFFNNSDELPDYLQKYKSLFTYQKARQEERLPDDFNDRILQQLQKIDSSATIKYNNSPLRKTGFLDCFFLAHRHRNNDNVLVQSVIGNAVKQSGKKRVYFPKKSNIIKIAASFLLLTGAACFMFHYKSALNIGTAKEQSYANIKENRDVVMDALCLISENMQKSESVISEGLLRFDIASIIDSKNTK